MDYNDLEEYAETVLYNLRLQVDAGYLSKTAGDKCADDIGAVMEQYVFGEVTEDEAHAQIEEIYEGGMKS